MTDIVTDRITGDVSPETAAASQSEPILRMVNIDKRFQGVHALKQVSLTLHAGEVVALVGENGAGKSTLMKVLTGIYDADSGEMYYNGKQVHFKHIKEAQEAGISIVHQELNQMNHLTVAQNIFIGRESKGFFLNEREIHRKTQELAATLNLKIEPTTKISKLTVGKAQMVEIARAISFESTILILDEPTAALSESEVQELFRIVRALKEKGVGIIFISHRMEEIKQIADTVVVMRDGESVGTLDAKTCTLDEIINRMVGRTIYSEPKQKSMVAPNAPVVLEAKSLNSPLVKDVSFTLRKGEILGFAGLVGAGRTETVRLLFGADPKAGGEVYINGERVQIKSPADAVRLGIGYLSEDRKRYGLAVGLSIVENVTITSLKNYLGFGPLLSKKKCDAITDNYVKELNIRTPSIRQLIRKLSGGNQQKVVIAKWLIKNCDIFIFDEPTRGIDVGAKSEIYKLMEALIKQGKSIIMISSELPEILRMSDRVIVMCEGRKTKELDISEANQEVIMKYATLYINSEVN